MVNHEEEDFVSSVRSFEFTIVGRVSDITLALAVATGALVVFPYRMNKPEDAEDLGIPPQGMLGIVPNSVRKDGCRIAFLGHVVSYSGVRSASSQNFIGGRAEVNGHLNGEGGDFVLDLFRTRHLQQLPAA